MKAAPSRRSRNAGSLRVRQEQPGGRRPGRRPSRSGPAACGPVRCASSRAPCGSSRCRTQRVDVAGRHGPAAGHLFRAGLGQRQRAQGGGGLRGVPGAVRIQPLGDAEVHQLEVFRTGGEAGEEGDPLITCWPIVGATKGDAAVRLAMGIAYRSTGRRLAMPPSHGIRSRSRPPAQGQFPQVVRVAVLTWLL